MLFHSPMKQPENKEPAITLKIFPKTIFVQTSNFSIEYKGEFEYKAQN